MPPEEIVRRLSAAYSALFAQDSELFDLGLDGVHEQTITFRLGLYLQHYFDEHHVDCEYNRVWSRPKGCALTDIGSMKPDVIVHRRVCDTENLLCIEAKKQSRWDHSEIGFASIERKLLALTRPDGSYRYPLGLAWQIVPSRNADDHTAHWFSRGTRFHVSPLLGFEETLLRRLSSFYQAANE